MKKNAEKDEPRQDFGANVAWRSPTHPEQSDEELARDLRAAQEELETFASCIARDLRAPLVHIGGFVDLLLNHSADKLDQQGQHYLRVIAVSTYRMGRLIEDLMELSRVTTAELNWMSIDLESLVRDVTEELAPLTAGRTVVWSVGALPMVEADPTLLREVVVQLLSNALKFTRPCAEARITIESQRHERETIVSIRDNGVGFDMRHREKMFGVFQRLHATSEFEGRGVGLVRVRRIVQRHGGRVWAEGATGVGATLHFSLPDRVHFLP